MIRFIYTGDWHRRGTNPRNRIDDFVAAFNLKLYEIFDLAKKWDVSGIIIPGDVLDRPEVSIAVLLEFVEVLKKSPVQIFTAVGNHDIYGYNLSTYNRSSLKLLDMLVPQFHVVSDPQDVKVFTDGYNTAVEMTFTPYSAKMDLNGYGYDPEFNDGSIPIDKYSKGYKIHVAHGMLLDHKPPFDRYTLIQDVQTTADMVLTGHDHTGYGVYRRADGKVFCNPGALMRLSASVVEIERPIQVALITVDGTDAGIELLPLTSAKPGDDVLDRSKIEAEKQRAYAMETFSALVEKKTGDRVLMDVNQIVEEIAKLEGAAPHIVKAALEVIDQQREKVK